jgi:Flp pilus assembly pilin Flp
VKIHSLPRAVRARITHRPAAGQGLAEYALILGLIALVSIAAVTGFGTKVASDIGQVVNSF